MKLVTRTISEKLSPALKAHRPDRSDVEQFARDLKSYLDHIDSKETEENLKTHLMGLLKSTYQPSHTIEQYGDIDFVIRTGGRGSPAAVLFEAKRKLNKADMIRQDDVNRKALHELVLYFLRERYAGNTDIRSYCQIWFSECGMCQVCFRYPSGVMVLSEVAGWRFIMVFGS